VIGELATIQVSLGVCRLSINVTHHYNNLILAWFLFTVCVLSGGGGSGGGGPLSCGNNKGEEGLAYD
jgi:hypothetical protein